LLFKQIIAVASASAFSGSLDRSCLHPGTISGRRSRRIRSKIASNNRFGTVNSTIWKTTCRACVTTLASTCLPAGRS
jgi:hypothetical protein